jgi:hypothetical protein
VIHTLQKLVLVYEFREGEMDRHMACMEENTNAYSILMGKVADKGPHGRHFHSYEDNINPYPTAFPYGNGMVLHFYQQQESSTTKTVHRVINKGLKTYV